jgi:hypothetical protein
MMLLSRFWYGILSLFIGVAIYVAYVGVGQYNRRAQVAMTEGLASDSQVVRWALQIDARRRLDAMLLGSVDKGVQEALVAAGKDKVPPKAREDAKKALDAISQKLPPEVRPTAMMAVDRDGRVIAQVGYDAATAFEDFELGGYPAVYDALHGYLRDDTWVLGGRVYRVVARPVEYDVAQPPVGAIVGLKALDDTFAKDIARLTRTNLIFFAGGIRVAQAFDAGEVPEKVAGEFLAEIGKIENDKAYHDTGRSGLRMLANDDVGAMFGRLDGDAWELRGGYAVARSRLYVKGPLGFLSGADDKDKANVPWAIIGAIVAAGLLLGLAFSFLEHTAPMNELRRQAEKLQKGEFDLLQLPRFRGGYRAIGQGLNAGIQRVAEKGGGAIRKEADLESILGPTPAQPAMSAFSFPQPGEAPPPSAGAGRGPLPAPSSSKAFGPPTPSSSAALGSASAGGAGLMGAGGAAPQPKGPPGAPPARPPKPPPPKATGSAPEAHAAGNGNGTAAVPPAPRTQPMLQQTGPTAVMVAPPSGAEEDRTTVGAPPQELLAQAGKSPSSSMMKAAEQAAAAGDEGAEWLSVYEEFLRTKKQCGEPTDGLTFEKFRQTLRKNRDALIQRHGCKRVKFSVYVKEGRASLKATPVKE